MKLTLTKQQIISLIITVALFLSILVGLKLVSQRQEIRKKAANASVNLALYPVSQDFNIGETKEFDLIASFVGGSDTEKLDYFYTEISFPRQYLQMPASAYVETVQSGFDKIFRVDGPNIANQTGRIVIEVGALIPHTGPSTANPVTLAKIFFSGYTQTPSPQNITIGINTQIVNDRSVTLTTTSTGASFNVISNLPLPTQTPTPTSFISEPPPPITLTPTPIPPSPTSATEPSATPILTTSTPIPSCTRKGEGDANCDGAIDGIDYSMWLNSQCFVYGGGQTCVDLRADFDGDQDVDDNDLLVWFNHSR